MFRQGQLAVHGLAILRGRNEAAISNRGKFFCTTLYFRIMPSIYSCLCFHPLTSAGHEAVALNPLLHTSVCSALSLPLWSIDRPHPVANGIHEASGSLSRSYLYVTFFCSAPALISSPPALREIAIPPFDRPLLQSPNTLSPLLSTPVVSKSAKR